MRFSFVSLPSGGGLSTDMTSCCCVIGGGLFLGEPRPSELRCISASRLTASISFFWWPKTSRDLNYGSCLIEII